MTTAGSSTAHATSTLLTLADGRFPAGGHAHSGGLEEAVGDGRARTIDDLGSFLAGRLHTVGRVEASQAAFAWLVAPSATRLALLHAEAAARSPSPAQRDASTAQGRALLRAAKNVWPAARFDGISAAAAQLARGPMYAIVLGAVGRAIGLGIAEVALVAAQVAVSGPAWASTRLLGTDPFAVMGCLAKLAPTIEEIAHHAVAQARDAVAAGDKGASLPACAAPLLEIGAERHACWEVRLFAS
ncbi:MAG TPA: urease accessory UreF family protein [Acidimicrobiales bacterium]|nr:urease accessory UreF family protein [Acidimicrobiales bacterium]